MSDLNELSKLWGDWTIKEQLGKGSFGSVFKAEKQEYGNTYVSAIKHLSIPPEGTDEDSLISDGIISSKEEVGAYYDNLRNQIINEINLCYALRGNTNIVSYEDHCIIPKKDKAGYDIYIRMEFLTPLPTYMRLHKFKEEDVIQLGKEICEALMVLENHHIIHRDIKPANIFVNSMGVYKLGDFGESKVLSNTSVGMTVRGTYAYMSPEISKGSNANITADIYSLGIVLYRLLNENKAPFVPLDKPTSSQMLEEANIRRFKGERLPLPKFSESRGLTSIIMKACEYNPGDRWQSPKEMKKAFESLENESAGAFQQIVGQYYGAQGAVTSTNLYQNQSLYFNQNSYAGMNPYSIQPQYNSQNQYNTAYRNTYPSVQTQQATVNNTYYPQQTSAYSTVNSTYTAPAAASPVYNTAAASYQNTSNKTDNLADPPKRSQSKVNVGLIVSLSIVFVIIIATLIVIANLTMNNRGSIFDEYYEYSNYSSDYSYSYSSYSNSRDESSYYGSSSYESSGYGYSSEPSESSLYTGVWTMYRSYNDTATGEVLYIYSNHTMDFYADGKLLYVGTWSVDLSGVLKFEFKEDGKDYYLEYKLKDDKIFSYDSEDPTNLSSFYGIKS